MHSVNETMQLLEHTDKINVYIRSTPCRKYDGSEVIPMALGSMAV